MRSVRHVEVGDALAALEHELHRRVLALPVEALSGEQATATITDLAASVAPMMGAPRRAELVARVLARVHGLGPLEPLLSAPGVTDVMVNGPGPVWVERAGRLERTDVVIDRETLEHLVERIVAPMGRRLDRTSPMVDARLPDGSRVHVVGAPVAVSGPVLTIRRFAVDDIALDRLAPAGVASLLRWAVTGRLNIVVSGGTSAGKTTLLNSLTGAVDDGERLVTIEDAAELRLAATHVVALEARPATVDGPPPVTIRDLVRTALRMRPDRIIVGEVRGEEALDMLQAMNTGHEGSLSTVHANSPVDALRRIETMAVAAASAPSLAAVRAQVWSAIDLVVQVERLSDGRRAVVGVAEPVHDDAGAALRVLADRSGLLAIPRRRARRIGHACASQAWLATGAERAG